MQVTAHKQQEGERERDIDTDRQKDKETEREREREREREKYAQNESDRKVCNRTEVSNAIMQHPTGKVRLGFKFPIFRIFEFALPSMIFLCFKEIFWVMPVGPYFFFFLSSSILFPSVLPLSDSIINISENHSCFFRSYTPKPTKIQRILALFPLGPTCYQWQVSTNSLKYV